MRRGLAAVALLSLLLAGCGDDDDDLEPSASRATTTAAPAGNQSTGTVDTKFTGQGSERFCTLARTYRDKLDRLGTTDPTQLKAIAQDAEASIRDALAAAPSEIKGDVQVVAAASSAFFQQLGRVNYDITKLSPDALAGLQKPEVQTSTQRLGAYTEKVCGISTSIP